ncbi:sensor domain-containing protein [Nocardioides convexus]|uniref:sensor histidine kinase n=1 Tax=Nocardioides convexus TaxID=2712224 RepID=UPI002418B58A|nr:sensor domain-containing protein [Nocardioides convexus]
MREQVVRARGPAACRTVGGDRVRRSPVLLLVPLVVVLVLTLVSAVLVVVWVGVLLLAGLLPVLRVLVGWHRTMAGRVLGAPVTASYLPLRGGPLAGLQVRAVDPMTWRDLLWVLWAVTAGFAVSLLTLVLLLAVVTWPLWWYGAGPLLRARAWVDRALLTIGRTEHLERRVEALTVSRAVVVDHSAAEPAPHRARPPRRPAGPPGGGVAEPGPGRRPLRDRSGRRPAAGQRRPLDLLDRARRACATWSAGSIPRCWPTAGSPARCPRWRWTWCCRWSLALDVPERLPAPVESAVYFTVAECLANAAKHAEADQTWISLRHADGVLRGEVGDDGRGGADPASGSGLQGVAARLAAFDGTMSVSSPPGGPTVVVWEVPCASSSPKTTRS